jgi:YVTN family beta-propeller protein
MQHLKSWLASDPKSPVTMVEVVGSSLQPVQRSVVHMMTMPRRNPLRVSTLMLTVFLSFTHASRLSAQVEGYHVIKRVNIGGDGGWDYLAADTSGRRLYVSHSTHVVVLDLDSLTIVGDIPNTPGVHGIAVAPALGKGFISNGRDTSVTIFDLKTLATLANVKVTGAGPDAITYDSASGHVFTFNGRAQNSTVLDAATNQVLATIELGASPSLRLPMDRVVSM